MRIALLYFLLLITTIAVAQEKKPTIVRDTINLHGYIYQNDGKPAKYFIITSTYNQAIYSDYNYKLAARTDTNGYFEIDGAKPYDTLTIAAHMLYNISPYYNKGSRYMVIYLPPLKTIDINSGSPAQISQKRLYAKPPAIYHPVPSNACILFSDLYLVPEFKRHSSNNGNDEKNYAEFIDSIKAHIAYPQKAIAANIEGTVQAGFTVGRDGRLIDIKIIRGIGYGCDEAVIDAIKKNSKWQPAIIDGRTYTMQQTVSVEFKLTDK